MILNTKTLFEQKLLGLAKLVLELLDRVPNPISNNAYKIPALKSEILEGWFEVTYRIMCQVSITVVTVIPEEEKEGENQLGKIEEILQNIIKFIGLNIPRHSVHTKE